MGELLIDELALLRLMRLSSPALPVGAYAYSQGMESAVDAQYVRDRDSAIAWLAGLMRQLIGRTDLPVLLRLSVAREKGDHDNFFYWNDWLLATRETHELHFEDTQLGAALLRILRNLDVFNTASPFITVDARTPLSFAAAFALAAHHWNIPTPALLLGYAWSWLENQVAAATKLVPLGQTDAQAIIEALQPVARAVCSAADVVDDAELGQSLPGLCHLSASHEYLYTRLFRS